MNRNRDDNQLIVTFYDSDQHTVLKKEYVDKCGSATPPKDPTRPGKSFAGWVGRYEEVACNENVYATYNDIDYVVTFKSHDGIILKSQHVSYGGSAKEPPIIPVWEGHSFTGWDKPFNYITEDTVVTALYDANTIKLTFVKYKDEEEPWFDVDIPVGTSYTLPDPEDGDVAWSFDYWVGNKDIYTQDTTIIARYKDAEETSYTYEFYEPLPGGQWAKITSFEHSGNIAWEDLYEEFIEDKIGVSTAFYKLLGWAETQGSKEKINDDKVFSGGKFYAIVKELPYEIQFVEYELEDGVYQEYKKIVNCRAGEAFNVPDFNTDDTFKKYEGLTFLQWEPFYNSRNVDYFLRGLKTFNLPTTATSGKQEDDRIYMTYQARFDKKIYKVSFVNYDYSLVKDFYCEYGHSVPDSEVPQPTKKPNPDAIFTGWIGSWENVIQDTVIIAGFGETPRHEVKYYTNRTYGPFTGSTPTLLYTDIVDDGAASEYTADEDIKNSMVYQNRTGNTSSWTFGNWKYEDGTDADLTEVTEDKVVYLDATPVTVTIKWLAKVVDPSNPFAQWEPVYNYKVLNNTLYNNADRYNAVSPESDDWSYYFTGPVTYETAYYKHSDGSVFDPTQGATEQIDCKVTFTPASYTINFYVGTDQIIGSGSIPDVTLSNTSADNLVSTDSITVNDDLIPYSGSSKNITGYNFLGWTLTKGSTTIDLPLTGAVWLQQFVNNKGITGTVINLYAVYEAKTFSSFDVFSFDGTLENIPGPDGTGSTAASLNSLSNVVYGIELSDLLNYVRFNYDKTSLKIATESAKRSLSPGWKKCNINGTLGYFYVYAANDATPYAGWPTVPFVCPFRILSFLKSEDGDYYWTSTDLTKHVGDTIDLTEYAAETPLHKDWRVTLGYNASLFEKVTVGTNPNCYKRDAEDFLLNCDEIVDDNYVITRQNPDVIYIIENKNFGEDESTLQFFYQNLIRENTVNTSLHSFERVTTEMPLDENTDWSAIAPREPERIRNLSQNKTKNADDELVYVYDYLWAIILSQSDVIYFIKNLDDLTDAEKQAIIDDGNAAAFWFPGVIKEDPNDHTRNIKGWGHYYYTDDSVTWETFDPDTDIRFVKVYEDSSAADLSSFATLLSRNKVVKFGPNPFNVGMQNDYTISDPRDFYLDISTGQTSDTKNSIHRTLFVDGDGTFSGLFDWDAHNSEVFENGIVNGLITTEYNIGNDGKINIEYDVNEEDNGLERVYDRTIIDGIPSTYTLRRNNDLFCIKSNYFNPEDSEQYVSKLERDTVNNTPIDTFDELILNSSPAIDENSRSKRGNITGLPNMCIFGIDTKYNYTVATTGVNITDAINRFVIYYAGRDHVFDICIPAGGFFAPKALAPEYANYGFLDIVWEDFRTHEEVDATYIANFNRTLGTSSSVAYIFVAKSFRIGAKLFLTRSDLGYRGFDEIYSRSGANVCQSIQMDKWSVLPTDNMTPCILYDFNHTVEENMNDPWIIAGNSSFTFYNLPFVKSSSFYNSMNESINGNGFSHSVNTPFNDLASGLCFKQKYNIINNWKNVDFERVWTSFVGVKRSNYKNIVGDNELFRIPIGAEKIYDSALYYYQYNAKPMEESHLSEDAIDSWKSETDPIAIPGNLTENDYIINRDNYSIGENPAAYYCYKNNIYDYDHYSPLGYSECYAQDSQGHEEMGIQYVGIINTQCNLDSIYHSNGGHLFGIFQQNRFIWYKDYDACLAIFEEVIDNLDMSEYESGTITNSNYVDNSTSNYISYSATTSSTVAYNVDNIKMNLDIPRVAFNYNIYREVSIPHFCPGVMTLNTFTGNTPDALDNIAMEMGDWGFHAILVNDLYKQSFIANSITNYYNKYLLIENSAKILYIQDYLTRVWFSSGHKGGILVNTEYSDKVANSLNGLYYVLPVTTAYTELFEYGLAAKEDDETELGTYFTSGKLSPDSTVKDILSYPNAIVNNCFSKYRDADTYSSYQTSFAVNDEDEDLPDFYNLIDYQGSITLTNDSLSGTDRLFHISSNGGNLTNAKKFLSLNCNSPELYRGCYDYKYFTFHSENRQSLSTIYAVKRKDSLGTAPASWGSPSGGVTGFTNEPNQQLRESIGLTTDFEINWSEKFKDNLLSTTESAIFVNRYSFTVNIYRKSDNKKLAHYTSIGDNLNPCLLIGVARKYEGTSIKRFGWRDAGNFYIPIDENYITNAMYNGLIRNGVSAVEGTDYVFIPMSDLNNGDTIDFTIDGVTYTCELSRKLFTAADKFSLYTKNIDYSFSNVE